jgi:hypothetical protein
MKGWEFVYLPQYAAPAELPPEMIAFKQQAHRWTKGSFQTAIKLLPKILRSRHLSYRIKTEAFFHLTNTLVYPLMVLLTLLIYPIFYMYVESVHYEAPLKHNEWGRFIFTLSLFILATCSASTFFVVGQRELLGKQAGWKTILYLPFLMSLGVGVGLNNAKAVLEAIWGAIRRKPSEFVRTPKYGMTGGGSQFRSTARVFTFHRLTLPILEIAFGCYMTACIAISIWYGFGMSSIPFLMIFAGGYFYVGFSSIHTLYRMHREAEIEAELAAATEPAST